MRVRSQSVTSNLPQLPSPAVPSEIRQLRLRKDRIAKKSKCPRPKTPPKEVLHGSDGYSIHNAILTELPREKRNAVSSKMEFVDLPVHTVLNEMAEPIKFCYFIKRAARMGNYLVRERRSDRCSEIQLKNAESDHEVWDESSRDLRRPPRYVNKEDHDVDFRTVHGLNPNIGS